MYGVKSESMLIFLHMDSTIVEKIIISPLQYHGTSGKNLSSINIKADF